ncbi:N-methyl-L-tryptophan oxidase [Candidatus Saccharibacteria bacterium]|nr:N-methyl-L-tryptophan oxidase [Candidatus Saccharibacteria bacterium]MCB9835074.1 N-methyl-L-tryptophan oxidase [Candidatus Nomurabacteria bacterium]
MRYDVIVVGLGAMGSATVYQLAKSGVNVLGIDQFAPPHKLGSTHGNTRITRLAIGEGMEYVPLVRRSHEIWYEIEKETGKELLNQCGGLIMTVSDGYGQHKSSDFLQNTYDAADKYGIKHEKLTNLEIKQRFPLFNIRSDERGYYEPEAGYVRPERCIEVQLELAKKYGATLNLNEKVKGFTADNSSVTIATDRGRYKADKLIISAGPWVTDFLPKYRDIFKIHRQVLYWFDIDDEKNYEAFREMPIFVWEFSNQRYDNFYGFPAVDGPQGGIKLATETYDTDTSPDDIEREVTSEEIQSVYDHYVKEQFPHLTSKCIKAVTCMYTDTPDAKFVIDFHPKHKNVIIASPCSGHGFKHSAAIGETLSQLAKTGKSDIDVSKFSFSRFRNA